ncbi:biopolymer transport protein ExbD [Luteibacter sp. UNC138MFCol5.1]|uniref:ExbD/TolR family protein n=1 Tax=Luteibacter sp. UNC138MFCol5.1 TaxID=1502774 RepID=UPI0008AF2DC6|nr:biopolymer transporter ExbD [Luteibacter sp. UNC138MFCol5.1]SEO61270.1 biopolymer transport protein ExbD [Luteibacter sp. UNC138MFCol5.1]
MAFSARHDQAPISGINVTPLVDVLLVLLIIFMISAPVIAHKSSLSFSSAGLPTDTTPPKPIRVAIDADGSTFWNGVLVTDATLVEQMRLAAAGTTRPVLDVAAADGASYEDVARVLAEAKVQGLAKVEFVER